MHRNFLMGVINHFAERWWGRKTVYMFKIRHESFSNCAKLSSALVSRIKFDRSLKSLIEYSTNLRQSPLFSEGTVIHA